MKNIEFKILSEEEYDANYYDVPDQALSRLGGCSDMGEQYGLGVWMYQFDVEVTNQNEETEIFTVAFQPGDRTNGMMNYAGDEIAPAVLYGYDADESDEVIEFCGGDEVVIDALRDIAQLAATAELERLTKEG